MKLGDVITSSTPCCLEQVRLTYDGKSYWTRLCTTCRKRYTVRLLNGALHWVGRHRVRRSA